MTAHHADLIKLVSEHLEISISPAAGAAVAWLRERGSGFDLLRETPPEAIAAGETMKFGCFPMLPYSNRVGFRRLCAQNRIIELAPNREGSPHAFHGSGWMQAWTVTSLSDTTLALSLTNAAGNPCWPFAYQAMQHFALEGNSLRLTLALYNSGNEIFPAGLGWHPFFRTLPGSRLNFSAAQVWLNDADMLPRQLIEAQGPWDFTGGRDLRGIRIDNCFSGWRRHARLEHPDAGLALSITASDTLSALVVFRPDDGREFVAIEPVSHVNNGASLLAQGRSDTGIRLLAPGEEFKAEFLLAVEPLPA